MRPASYPGGGGLAASSQVLRPLLARPTLFEHGVLPIPANMPTVEQLCDMVGRIAGSSAGSAGQLSANGRLSIASWHKIAKETFKMDTGYAQLVFEIFFDCQDVDSAAGLGDGMAEFTDVNVIEFAIYLFVLATYKDEALMGGTPRALRADIAYPNLVMQDQKEPLSPRSSQPLSPRTVAAGTKQTGRPVSGGLSPPKSFFGSEHWPTPMSTDGQGHSTDRQGVFVVANLHKTTLIRSASELMGSHSHVDNAPEETVRKDLRVQHCNESFIYISAPLRRVVVTGCNHCTVFVAACTMLTIENCERVKIISGCRRMRVANCVDSTLHLLTVRQPLLLGENHDLVLAPFNALASDCLRWWPMIRIDRNKNRWSEPLSLSKGPYGGVCLAGGTVSGQSLMPPEAFFCSTIPSNTPLPASVVAAQANPCPLPPAYAAALQNKHKQVLDLRKEISETEAASSAPKAALQKAIQAKFKEWLVSSGNLRQVQDLVHLDSVHAESGHGRGSAWALEHS